MLTLPISSEDVLKNVKPTLEVFKLSWTVGSLIHNFDRQALPKVTLDRQSERGIAFDLTKIPISLKWKFRKDRLDVVFISRSSQFKTLLIKWHNTSYTYCRKVYIGQTGWKIETGFGEHLKRVELVERRIGTLQTEGSEAHHLGESHQFQGTFKKVRRSSKEFRCGRKYGDLYYSIKTKANDIPRCPNVSGNIL